MNDSIHQRIESHLVSLEGQDEDAIAMALHAWVREIARNRLDHPPTQETQASALSMLDFLVRHLSDKPESGRRHA